MDGSLGDFSILSKDLFDRLEHHGAGTFGWCDDAAFSEFVPGIDRESLPRGAIFPGKAERLVFLKRFLHPAQFGGKLVL